MKRKEYVEVKMKLYKHQLDWLEKAAKKRGKAMAKRRGHPAWVHWQRILRMNLDTYIFAIEPRLKEILRNKKDAK